MTALLAEPCLNQHPFFEGCSPEFLNYLREFASEVEVQPGELVLAEGDYADRFYLVCEGEVALQTSQEGGAPLTIQMLGPGDLVGWSWLYPPFQWQVSARAVTRSKLICLNAASVLIRAEEHRVFGYELMKRISQSIVRALQTTRQRLLEEASRKPLNVP